MLNMLKKNKKGFTLIETIIVMVVIAVLVGFLLTRFNAVKAKANENACYNHRLILEASAQEYMARNDANPNEITLNKINPDPNNLKCPDNGKYELSYDSNNKKFVIYCDKHNPKQSGGGGSTQPGGGGSTQPGG